MVGEKSWILRLVGQDGGHGLLLCLRAKVTSFNLFNFRLFGLHFFDSLNRNFYNLLHLFDYLNDFLYEDWFLNYSLNLLDNDFFYRNLFYYFHLDDFILKNHFFDFFDLNNRLFNYLHDLDSFNNLIWRLNLYDFNNLYRYLLHDLSDFNFDFLMRVWNLPVHILDDLNGNLNDFLYDLYFGGLNRHLDIFLYLWYFGRLYRDLYIPIKDLRIASRPLWGPINTASFLFLLLAPLHNLEVRIRGVSVLTGELS